MITRQTFLQSSLASGVALASQAQAAQSQTKKAKRVVFICSSLGFLDKHYYPNNENPVDSEYLQPFSSVKNDFSLFRGLSHDGLLGSLHQSERCFLTAARDASSPTFQNSISIDQVIAQQIGAKTRFPFLNLSLGDRGLCHSNAGVMLPPMTSDVQLYDMLFKQKSQSTINKEKKELDLKRNMLLASMSNSFRKSEMKEYYEKSVHQLDQTFERQKNWLDIPLPKVEEHYRHPKTHDAELLKRFENFLMGIRLAFQTDSTRTAVLHIPFYNKVPIIEGIDTSWHRLTHNGGKKDKIAQLVSIEKRALKIVADFVKALKATPTEQGNLLDETIVLVGSNLGQSNSHNPLNLPIFMAGGGFEHGKIHQHSADNNTPLSQLFLSITHQLEGVKLSSFKGEKSCLRNFA